MTCRCQNLKQDRGIEKDTWQFWARTATGRRSVEGCLPAALLGSAGGWTTCLPSEYTRSICLSTSLASLFFPASKSPAKVEDLR